MKKSSDESLADKAGNSPSNLIGPAAALYRSFDSPDHLVLMQGTQELSTLPLVTGKVIED